MTYEEKLKKLLRNPVLYIQNFMKVVDKKGKVVNFKLNPEQKHLLKTMGKYNIVLKSRQLGISTLSTAYAIYLASTNPFTTCLLMSYSLDSAQTIFEKLKELYNLLPEDIKIKLIANNRKELKFVNGSRIIVTTCGNKDVARGATIRFAHLSEVGFMKDTVNKQLLAIEQALTPNGQIILESTANGLNYFSELYNKAERGENLYNPFFFSWVNDKVMFADEYKDFAKMYYDRNEKSLEVKELTYEEHLLYENNATLEQLMWRRLKIGNSSDEQFKQEFPSNPTEAFIATYSNVFNSEKVHNKILALVNCGYLTNRPHDIPNSFIPYFKRELTIWDVPIIGMKYYIGVDTGEGGGGDYSAIEVLSANGQQVAEFKSNKIEAYKFSELLRDIVIYYNKALLVVEKASTGHSVVDKLKNHYRYVNMYKYIKYDTRGQMKRVVGYSTDTKTKPIMINDLIELFDTDSVGIKSKDLLNKMKTYQLKGGKYNAIQGYHDDLIMAFAMAIQGMKSKVHYI